MRAGETVMKHTYALYLIDIGLEIERRNANDALAEVERREKAFRRIRALEDSRGVLERDAAKTETGNPNQTEH